MIFYGVSPYRDANGDWHEFEQTAVAVVSHLFQCPHEVLVVPEIFIGCVVGVAVSEADHVVFGPGNDRGQSVPDVAFPVLVGCRDYLV